MVILGFFVGCILMSGAYSDENPLETSPSCERWVTQKVFSVHLDQECLQSFPTKGVVSFKRHQKNRVKIEFLMVSTTPEPKAEQKSSREISP